MKNFKFKSVLAIMALSLLSLTSCKDEKKMDAVTEETPTEEVVTSEAPATVDITLNSNDAMQFDKSEITVKAGETVVLTLNHTGKLPIETMGHNFVLLKQGTVMADFGAAAAQSKATDYIPNEGKDVIAHTKTIGGGESTTVTFTAPEKGTYDFLCSFPGHYAMMKGKLIVE